MTKTVVKPFNSLEHEQRHMIAYYRCETQIITIKQCIKSLDNYIGKKQKQILNEWVKNCEKWKNDNYILESED